MSIVDTKFFILPVVCVELLFIDHRCKEYKSGPASRIPHHTVPYRTAPKLHCLDSCHNLTSSFHATEAIIRAKPDAIHDKTLRHKDIGLAPNLFVRNHWM